MLLMRKKNPFLTSLHRGKSAEVCAKSSHSRRRLRCVGPRSIVASCQRRSDADGAEQSRGGLTCALRCCLSAEARLRANTHTAGDGVRSRREVRRPFLLSAIICYCPAKRMTCASPAMCPHESFVY